MKILQEVKSCRHGRPLVKVVGDTQQRKRYVVKVDLSKVIPCLTSALLVFYC